jgi:hypothetical protein
VVINLRTIVRNIGRHCDRSAAMKILKTLSTCTAHIKHVFQGILAVYIDAMTSFFDWQTSTSYRV